MRSKLKKHLLTVLLILIFFLGSFLRFYDLGKTPDSLDWDEVSWGYNAYSVLKTGKDEYGSVLPLSFKAFGDYKQPVYAYADVLPIKVFGLNAFSIRFPSALLGSLSILFVFLFVLELFKKNKNNKSLALVSAFLFSISPWAIQFSRVAFEANTALFFVILSVWLFFKGLNNKNVFYLVVSLLPMAISAYTYLSEKLFVPIFFLGLLFYGYKNFNLKKTLLIGLCILFFLLNLTWLVDARTTARGRNVLFTSNSAGILDTSFRERIYDAKHGDILGRFVLAPKVIFVEKYVQNYFSHFDLNWLFFKGDNPRHHAPGFGLLYFMEFPFILFGIFYLLKYNSKEAFIICFWILVAPLASSLAIDAPNASRSEIFLPMWQILSAVGIVYAYGLLKGKKFFKLGILIFILLFVLNFAFYLNQYFVQTNTDAQKDWQYGYKEAIQFSVANVSGNQKIIFSNNFEQPYIFYLVYVKYNPATYISQGGSSRTSEQCFSINNAYFGNCQSLLRRGDLYLSLNSQTPLPATEIKRINYAYGDPAVSIYRIN